MSTVPAREFHGRDAELALIRGELERLSDGAEAVVVVEGAAGMGKSRLLTEIAAIARGLDVRVGSSAADPGETVVELAALLAALFEGSDPLLDPGGLTPLHAQPEQRFWLLRDLQQLLERAALDSPLMIAIDDAHWADSGTVAAIRTLPMRLMGLPIAWVIALRPPREATSLVHALDQLKGEGAQTVVLGPLDDDAVVQLATDMLSAQPDASILKQLAEADGSPFFVVETLLGLQEEARIRVVDGRAELIDGQLPRRVHEKMRERLGRLSDEASDAVTVAASLGRTFTFDELARTLGQPASDLLAPVGELLEANLLVERDEKLAFWHDITREAVRASVPVTARRALDRQAAGVLLEAGALPVEVAVQLAASAQPGDEVAIATLLDAAKALVTTDPGTAARVRRARPRDRTGPPSASRGDRRHDGDRAAHRRQQRGSDRVRRPRAPRDAARPPGGRSPPQHRRHVRDLARDQDRRRAPRPEPPRPPGDPARPPPRLPLPQPRHRRSHRGGACGARADARSGRVRRRRPCVVHAPGRRERARRTPTTNSARRSS